ncbi:hypothetical protein WME76_13055 [Sorangium sp. So ce119]|uniref:hypothetical protein n=1 Tax=Sorangium sp. So ce119 TaxID=3133279 RepID=UPI003F62CB5A
MKLRISSFIAAATVAILSPLAGCSDTPEDTGAGGAGGSDSGSTSTSGSTSSSVGSGGAGSTSASSGGDGGGGSTGSGNAVAPTFDTVKFVIERTSCFGAGCHNDDLNALDLKVDGELRTRLTTHISENCGNLPIVNPGKPEESALVKILKEPCGDTPRMPIECVNDGDAKCVPPDYIEAIEQWIADGAQE